MIDSPATVGAGQCVSQAPLERDVLCIHCEYNLRTLSPDGLCPECGNPVEHSLRGFLESCGRGWLRRMYWGVGLLFPMPILLGIWPLTGLLHYVTSVHWYILCMSLVHVAGLWMISVDPRQRQVKRPPLIRWALRISAVGCSIFAALLVVLLVAPDAIDDLSEWMGFASGVVLALPTGSSLLLIAHIARGDGDRKLARMAMVAGWCAGATILAFGLAFILTEGIHLLGPTDTWVTSTFPIAGACALWSSLVLGRFQQRLGSALRPASSFHPLAGGDSWRRNMAWGIGLASIMPLSILFFMEADEKGHLLWTALMSATGLWLMGTRSAENQVFPSWLRWATRIAGIAIGLVAIANLFEIDAQRWQYRQLIGFVGGFLASIAVICIGVMLVRVFGRRGTLIWGLAQLPHFEPLFFFQPLPIAVCESRGGFAVARADVVKTKLQFAAGYNRAHVSPPVLPGQGWQTPRVLGAGQIGAHGVRAAAAGGGLSRGHG